MAAENNAELDARSIVTTRVIDAPRELVFDAFTNPEHLARWWGPIGFTTTTHSFDLRAGGGWRLTMHGPDGRDYENHIVYDEVVRPERLVYTHGGDKGAVQFKSTVTFENVGGKTRLTMRGVFPSKQDRDRVAETYGAVEGAKQTLGRLDEFLSDNMFTISRSFDAPRDLVWNVFSQAEHLAKWWGPSGMEWVRCSLDFRPGGLFHYCMKAPNGAEMWGKFVYREIAPMERVVFVNSFCDAAGNTTRAPFAPDWPLEVLNSLSFSEKNGKTTLTLRGGPINATAAERDKFKAFHSSMQQGFGGTFAQLDAYLLEISGKAPRELTLTRVLNAPRALVFKAWTDPKMLATWWGPKGFTNPRGEVDARPGGAIHIDMRAPDGTVYPMDGRYEEVVAPERLVFKSGALDKNGKTIFTVLTTVTFAETGGKTTLTMHARVVEIFDVIAERHLGGMNEGWNQSLDRLGVFVEKN
ncbi:MAG: SRPBCC domain-containing protein [Rhizomicrobium sp.]